MLQPDACQLCLEGISLPALYYYEDLDVAKRLLIYFTQYYSVVLTLQQLRKKKQTAKQFRLKTDSLCV